MKLTINSRKFGHPVEFSRPGGGYVYVDLSKKQNRPGTLGSQICDGGNIFGSTISFFGDSDRAFEKVCRRWWRAYIKNYI